MAGPAEAGAKREKGAKKRARTDAEVQASEAAQAAELERLLFGARDDFLDRLPGPSARAGNDAPHADAGGPLPAGADAPPWGAFLDLGPRSRGSGEEGDERAEEGEGGEGVSSEALPGGEGEGGGEEEEEEGGGRGTERGPRGRGRKAQGPGGGRGLVPAWVDEEDARVSVDLSARNRLRKLRRSNEERVVGGADFEERLRAQHLRLHPATSWAQLPASKDGQGGGRGAAAGRGRKGGASRGTGSLEQRGEGDTESEDEGAEEEGKEGEEGGGGGESAAEALLLSGKSLLGKASGGGRLLPGRVELSRLRSANQEEPSRSVVRSVHFHPNAQLLLTAGLDKRLRLFQVNGRENPKVQSVYFEDTPIFKAQFCSGGGRVLVAGRRKWYYIYDVTSGAVERVHGIVGREERSLESFALSDAASDTIAFLGKDGFVSLVSLKSRQWIGEVKLNGTVRCAAFANGGKHLVAAGGDGEVYHWDLRTLRCLHRARDEGSLGCTALAVSPNDEFLASGSTSGVVNVYGKESFLGGDRKPLRALMNLTTTIDTLAFHPDSQLLAMASRMKKDSVRMVHLPSAHVYPNWPSPQEGLQYVHCVDFSARRGLLCLGNAKGQALLYRLHHYSNF